MAWQDKLRGFYAIVDRVDDALIDELLSVAHVLQVRVKESPGRLRDVAVWARARTREAGALLVVNDSVEVALAVRADGVHLGQSDQGIGQARLQVGTEMLIGLSTHNAAQVQAAVQAGADYLGYGPVFPTRTKENPDPVQGLGALQEAVTLAGPVPVVAIGGITVASAVAVAATGASAACAIASVNGAASPAKAAAAIATGFSRLRSQK